MRVIFLGKAFADETLKKHDISVGFYEIITESSQTRRNRESWVQPQIAFESILTWYYP